MASGTLIVDGPAGDYAGACMSGGEMIVRGNARDLAACEMAGGVLTIEGNAATSPPAPCPAAWTACAAAR